MRKIIVFTAGPYVGTDAYIATVVPTSWTDAQIVEEFLDWAWENWEQWVNDFDEEGLEDNGPDVWFEDYDPKKHEDARCGGSFEEDFAQC